MEVISESVIRVLFPKATDAQVAAISDQTKVYEEEWCPAFGLHSIEDAFTVEDNKDNVAVRFNYWADDERDQTGVEITIFGPDGSTVESQDFG
jgi:hypothetical protein